MINFEWVGGKTIKMQLNEMRNARRRQKIGGEKRDVVERIMSAGSNEGQLQEKKPSVPLHRNSGCLKDSWGLRRISDSRRVGRSEGL